VCAQLFNGNRFDVAVIGGGVVGCAVARRFVLEGAHVVLLEKAPDILCGSSKGNSALLHTGFDAPAGSLELDCIRAGYAEYEDIAGRLGLPQLKTGALVVAWSQDDLRRLDGIEALARTNDVEVRLLSRSELLARESNLSDSALGALLIPGESVIDPWSAPLAYLRQAVENGGETRFDAEVLAGALESHWRLETSAGVVRAATVINCGGLYGDVIEERLLGRSGFRIQPRKGQFVVFDKAAATLFRSILLPVPTELTKGVLLTRTIFGNVLVGPTSEEQDERERAAVDESTLRALVARAERIIPKLKGMPVIAAYAGLRPATERKEYRVSADRDRRWISAGGIRSTGLTSALGLAKYVFDLYSQGMGNHTPIAEPIWPRVPNLAEHCTRDWQVPSHGEIVCHCEMVTRREVEAALKGPLPARDLSGLKRRTRATMGACQGFYCAGHVQSLTNEYFDSGSSTRSEA
jgi:glycerol-3-phosphate dehydrogenase